MKQLYCRCVVNTTWIVQSCREEHLCSICRVSRWFRKQYSSPLYHHTSLTTVSMEVHYIACF
jgi:hypothetical protein